MTDKSAHDATKISSGTEVPMRCQRNRLGLGALAATVLVFGFSGCGTTPAPKTGANEPAKPAEPEIPAPIQAAADALLGSETKVLLYGDLAKTGKQQLLVANVVPKTPKENIPGTIVTRAVIAENNDGMWTEVFRCDEHLKNSKGYLGM